MYVFVCACTHPTSGDSTRICGHATCNLNHMHTDKILSCALCKSCCCCILHQLVQISINVGACMVLLTFSNLHLVLVVLFLPSCLRLIQTFHVLHLRCLPSATCANGLFLIALVHILHTHMYWNLQCVVAYVYTNYTHVQPCCFH